MTGEDKTDEINQKDKKGERGKITEKGQTRPGEEVRIQGMAEMPVIPSGK